MRTWLPLLSLIAILVGLAASAADPEPPAKVIPLMLGKGDLLRFDNDVQRVAVSEPKVADAIVVSGRSIPYADIERARTRFVWPEPRKAGARP